MSVGLSVLALNLTLNLTFNPDLLPESCSPFWPPDREPDLQPETCEGRVGACLETRLSWYRARRNEAAEGGGGTGGLPEQDARQRWVEGGQERDEEEFVVHGSPAVQGAAQGRGRAHPWWGAMGVPS